MKKKYHIYLTEAEHNNLIVKAGEVGLVGRGCLSRYFSKIANSPIVFLDENAKAILRALDLS